MTSNVKLLPLPAEIRARDFKWTAVEVYARANVLHHTATKDAEIEALRAEVERLNRILGRIVEGDDDSTTTIRAGINAFAAAREYLRRKRAALAKESSND